MKILIVIGTRPEAIKMAPLIIALKRKMLKKNVKVCVTAQHRKMLDDVLNIFEINPDFDLNIMKKNQNLFDITTSVLMKMKEVLEKFKPNLLLVHGDTSTTLASSLAGFYKKIPIAHIESGLRTNNLMSPWPEEANRKITDTLSHLHFPPNINTKNFLKKENIKSISMKITGNTVIDSLIFIKNKINKSNKLKKRLESKYNFLDRKKKLILVTAHRRENFGIGIREICKSLEYIANKNPQTQIVYPVHLNPNISNTVYKLLSNIDNIHLIKPIDYVSFVFLMMKSYIILTDSGGIQEEAPTLSKPLIIVRDETERPEIIKLGGGKLAPRDSKKIIQLINQLIKNKKIYKKMASVKNPYGDGKASKRIIKTIFKFKKNFN